VKIIFFLSSLIFCSLTIEIAFAEDVPKGSSYDKRIQRVSYNPEDVIKIYTQLGFITTIIFDDNEIVKKAISGFDAGWKIIPYQNKLFVSPVPVEQEYSDGEESDVEMKKYEPIAKDWKTNLFVSTNKRSYSMDLSLSEGSKGSYAHIVRFWYPEKDASLRDAKQIEATLAHDKYPRNWDYFVKAGQGSENIVPDFAYDDGRLTYLGFGEIKNFPNVFLLHNGMEQTVNHSVEQKGNYKVMVIHKLSKTFVLRYGSQVVGVLNKSFGKYVKPYSSTSSSNVGLSEELND
jgi:type IV secretion system protein VirB9